MSNDVDPDIFSSFVLLSGGKYKYVNPVGPSELLTIIYLLPGVLKLNIGVFCWVAPVVIAPVTVQFNELPTLLTFDCQLGDK